jgi:hypothetical protein
MRDMGNAGSWGPDGRWQPPSHPPPTWAPTVRYA